MTYTDDSGLPLDDVRDLVGDVSGDPDKEYLSDEEVEKEITRANGSVYLAASRCCAKIAARMAPWADFSIGRKSKSKSQAYSHFLELSQSLRAEAKRACLTGMAPPQIQKVRDTLTYPDRFVHGDEQPVEWPLGKSDININQTEDIDA